MEIIRVAKMDMGMGLQGKPFVTWSLDFDAQKGSFTVGNTVYQTVDNVLVAQGIIFRVIDAGTTGTLILRDVVGTFQNNKIIYESALGAELITSSDFTDAYWSTTDLTKDDANTVTLFHNSGRIFSDPIVVTASTYYIFSFTPNIGTVTAPLTAGYNLSASSFIFENVAMSNGVSNSIYFTTPVGCISFRAYPVRNATTTGTMDSNLVSLKKVTNAALANGTVY